MTEKLINKIGNTLFSTTSQASQENVLVCIFLRGGADGLNMVVPVGDRFYYYLRPVIRILEPGWKNPKSGIDLNGYFAFHPALGPLKQFYKSSNLAIIHAVGLPSDTHSHFEAQANLESGTVASFATADSWLARHLASKAVSNPSPLRAVAFSSVSPGLLRGYQSPAAFQSLSSFRMNGRLQDQIEFQNQLQTLYNGSGKDLGMPQTVIETQKILDTFSKINMFDFASSKYINYPQTPFGRALAETYELINASLGIEIVCLDMDGWDTHADEGSISGILSRQLVELGQGLTAFVSDLGNRMKNVLIMTISEFGRRAAENASHGTDHGHGNAMFLLGGGVQGGKIYGNYPTLSPDKLYGPGDLAVTTDYRDVFAEVVQNWLGNPNLASVFPDYAPASIGVVSSS